MTVRRTYTPGVVCVTADAALREAARRLRDERVGMLVVVEGWEAVGVVTDRDLAVRALAAGLDPDTTPVRQVASSPAVSVHEDDPLEHVVAIMKRTGHRRLLVVSSHGRPCGVVSIDDVVRRLATALHGLGELVSEPARPDAVERRAS